MIENLMAATSYAAARFPTRKAAERAAEMARKCLSGQPPESMQIDTVNMFQFNDGMPCDESSPHHVILFTATFTIDTDDPRVVIGNLAANQFLPNCESCISDGEIVTLPEQLLGEFVQRAIRNMAEDQARHRQDGPRLVRRTNNGELYGESLV